jgi:GNAT superfamily N-acetyltransferase
MPDPDRVTPMRVVSPSLNRVLDDRLTLLPLGPDDFSAIRHLHATSLRAQTVGVLSDAELAAFVRLVHSPIYFDVLAREEMICAWLDGELVGSASWQANAPSGHVARIGCIFARHQGFGIGQRLLAAVEARAQQCGFSRFAVGVTANAVPFFRKQGYAVASHGVKTLAGCALPVTFLRKDAPDPRMSQSLN